MRKGEEGKEIKKKDYLPKEGELFEWGERFCRKKKRVQKERKVWGEERKKRLRGGWKRRRRTTYLERSFRQQEAVASKK